MQPSPNGARLLLCGEPHSSFSQRVSRHPRPANQFPVSFEGLSISSLTYSTESKTTRMNAIIEMHHINTVVRTIKLPDVFKIEEVYRNSIVPRLEIHRTFLTLQRKAVKRADPSICPPLLGRAVHVVRHNPQPCLSVSVGERPSLCSNRGGGLCHSFAERSYYCFLTEARGALVMSHPISTYSVVSC
jgi:hypothetical protein